MSALYNFFGSILRFIYDFIGNYGWSIVVLALFAKILTLPLTVKQTRSSQIMGALAPLQQQIQKKYANNKDKMNIELQKLYAKYRYNPLSSCFPLLIQLPIIIGLYGAVRQPTMYVFSEAEYAAVSKAFLWIEDLSISTMQSFTNTGLSTATILSVILPLINVIATVIQQAQTTKNMNQQQGQKGMMIFSIVMIGYLTLSYQQALALYWAMQTIIGIITTMIIYKFFPINLEKMEMKAAQKEKALAAKYPNRYIEQKNVQRHGTNNRQKSQQDYIQPRPKNKNNKNDNK